MAPMGFIKAQVKTLSSLPVCAESATLQDAPQVRPKASKFHLSMTYLLRCLVTLSGQGELYCANTSWEPWGPQQILIQQETLLCNPSLHDGRS